jgi:hypothetical protein
MPEKLTEAAVRALTFEGKPRMVRDAKVTGLMVAVNKTNKSCKVQRDLWVGDRGRKRLVKTVSHTLGGTDEMTLDEARSRAIRVIEVIKSGIDPNAPQPEPVAEQADTWTVRRMYQDYAADMTARECAPRTVLDILDRLNTYLPKLADTPTSGVRRSTARAEHQRISRDHGKERWLRES